jgi:ABC-2 type transport system ATP-binding protein
MLNKIDILSVKNLNKSYGKCKILEDVSFSIKSGSIFGLLGLNGVGKTTIIKSIVGLIDYKDKNCDGAIDISSKSISNYKGDGKDFFYLPEKFQPARYLTGWDFLEIGLRFYNSNLTEQFKKEALRLADLVELDKLSLSRTISSYSKGMCQKIGLILAKLSEAKLLILDEPMSGLDPVARIKLKQILINYKNDGGSVMLSSHLLNDIDEICDSIAVLSNKKIVYNGTPKGLKELFPSKDGNNTLEQSFLQSISHNS